MQPVVIVGGGISGLSAAYYLGKSGLPVTLIERDAQLGGIMRTERAGGCVIERGCDSWISNKPWARELAEELGLRDQLIGSNDHLRATYIWKGKRLVRMPDGLKLMVPSRLRPALTSSLIGVAGKFKIAAERFRRPLQREADVSVAQFTEEHFGRDVSEYLADPLLAGVYGGDARELSAMAVMPKFVDWEREFGSLTRAASRDTDAPGQALFTTLKNGLGTLIDELQEQASADILINGTVEKIEKGSGTGYRVRVNGDWLDASQLIVACRAEKVLPSLFPPIPYSSSTVVALVYKKSDVSHPLNGFGFLVPRIERRSISACTWVGTKFEHRVPADKVLLRCFVSGNVRDVPGELREKMGITAEPELQLINPWPESMPQYTVGHLDKIKIIDEMLSDFPGLHLTGNAYHGVGIPDCVRMAKEVAHRVLASREKFA